MKREFLRRTSTQFRVRRAAITLLASLLPLAAFASDGALEIHQACVAAGCFAGDDPGFPVTIAAAGSYALTSNLTVPDAATSAIQFDVPNVTLDLGGFVVAGPVVCTGEPVTSCGPSGSGVGISTYANARIHGGTVRGFGGTGIGVDDDSRIWDLVVTNNGGTGIALSRGGSVRNSTVTFNGGSGITANTGGGFGEVAGCTVRGNNGDGVTASAGLIVDSRFQNNAFQGIDGSAAAGGNVVSGNAGTPDIGASVDVIACNQVDSVVVCPP
jgi:hypothetical protein